MRGSEIQQSKTIPAMRRLHSDSYPTMNTAFRNRFENTGHCWSGWQESPAAARNLVPLPVPPGESRGGRVPPTPEARCPPTKSAGIHRCCRLPPQGKCPRGAGPYARGTWFTGWGRGRLKGAQVAEVGRSPSGAVKAKHKRGPKFRAPYSGYGLRQHPRLIPIRRVLHLRDLAPT
jgi:hypothetical protein